MVIARGDNGGGCCTEKTHKKKKFARKISTLNNTCWENLKDE